MGLCHDRIVVHKPFQQSNNLLAPVPWVQAFSGYSLFASKGLRSTRYLIIAINGSV
jgi:hypothetical protein